MADTNLNFTVALNQIVSAVNSIKSALNGDLIPRGANGLTTDNVADLGSSTKAWRRLYVKNLNVGGSEIALAGLASSNYIDLHTESDSSFTWPYTETNCLAMLYSGSSGGGGGGGGGAGASNDSNGREDGEDGEAGEDGGATIIELGSDTFTTGTAPGGDFGRGGERGDRRVSVTQGGADGADGADGAASDYTLLYFPVIEGGGGGTFGFNRSNTTGGDGGRGGAGMPGGRRCAAFHFVGLSASTVFDITIGAGGDGGAHGDGGDTYSGWASNTAGSDGSDGHEGEDGFAILIPY